MMAYTLKTTGLATKLVFCLMVDEEGTTIKEFVSSTVDSNKTVGATVSIGTGTWKSVSRPYFETANDTTGGITFPSGYRTTLNAATCGFYIAVADLANAAFLAGAIVSLSSDGASDHRFGRRYNENYIATVRNGDYRVNSATAPATNTKFSAAINHGDSPAAYYGLESSSDLASDLGTYVTGYNYNDTINKVGGQYFSNGKFYLLAIFDEAISQAEYESLHDDYIGTLFDSSGGSSAGAAFHYYRQAQ